MAYEVIEEEERGSFEREAKPEDYGFSDRVMMELGQIGIRKRPRPTYNKDHLKIFPEVSDGEYFDGRMPLTVRKLSLDQLSDMYGLFKAWYDYLLYNFSLWKTKYSEASAQATLVEAKLRRKAEKELGLKGQEQRNYALTSWSFVEFDAELEFRKAMFDYIDAQVKITSKNLSLISREITIREMKVASEGRFKGYGAAVAKYVRMAGEEEESDGTSDEPVPSSQEDPQSAPSRARGKLRDYRVKKL